MPVFKLSVTKNFKYVFFKVDVFSTCLWDSLHSLHLGIVYSYSLGQYFTVYSFCCWWMFGVLLAPKAIVNNASLNMFLHVFWCKYHAFLLGVCMWGEIAFPKWVLPVLFPTALNQSSCCSVPSPGLLWGSVSKESAYSAGDCLQHRRHGFVPWVGKMGPLEKEMATHSSVLPWEIPWMEEPGGLQSMGLWESYMTEWL